MSLHFLDSSSLAAVAYHHDRQCLRVQFRNGACYQYQGVPHHLFIALLAAPSQGSFFNHSIRGSFAYTRCATLI
jgi:hypothetical protein